jgi:sugar lactone lactonase YvrE
LRRLQQRFPEQLVIIGVHSAKFSSERSTGNIRQAVMRLGIRHPVVNDAGFKIWNAYNVHAWPTVALIDPRGKIAVQKSGEIDAQEFIPTIEAVLQEFEREGLLIQTPLEARLEREARSEHVLAFPSKVLATGDGRLYVSDSGHHRVLELLLESQESEQDEASPRAEILRVFGSGMAGLQDGGGQEAQFNHPRGLALSGSRLYVADTENHAIRRIDLESGQVRTIAGTGEKGWGKYNPDAPTETALRSPWDLLALEQERGADQDLILFIAMAGSHQIWLFVNEERLGIFAGNGREALVDGELSQASFNQPSGLALGWGHLFVADAEASAIRAIALGAEAKVFTLVGEGLFEFGDVDGEGTQVRLQHATGIAFYEGSLYLADTYNNKIKRLDPMTSRVQTLIGSGEPGNADGDFEQAGLYEPEGLSASDGRLYIADTNNHLLRIANLGTGRLATLELNGLQRLNPPNEGMGGQVTLEQVTLHPGIVTITFALDLPNDFKLNQAAPSTLVLEKSGENLRDYTYTFSEDYYVTFETEIDQDTQLALDLSVYYCETKDQRLCRILTKRLKLPVQLSESAPESTHITYNIEVPLDKGGWGDSI